MLIIGAGGLARELLQVVKDINLTEQIFFYDDINTYSNKRIYNEFSILNSLDDVKTLFHSQSRDYLLGIGNPIFRKGLRQKFDFLGGILNSSISPYAKLGKYDVKIGNGCNILAGATVSNSVSIGECCLLYYGTIATHDCIIGDYVEISPNATLLGRCEVGPMTQIGANSTVLPNVKIGTNVVIGAGSVVTRDVLDNSVVYGVPARFAKNRSAL